MSCTSIVAQICVCPLLCLLLVAPSFGEPVHQSDARTIVEQAFDYWRGMSSISRFSMTIHRPDFERTMVLRGWTKGRQDALFFVDKPPRDTGNGTLKRGRDMWSYNPKINRVVKLPPSMMSQSWMGSDFSNHDLAKSDSILDDYIHTLSGQKVVDGITIYAITSVAREDAPVVWGKQELLVRKDGILLRQAYFDEEMVLVKEMLSEQIEDIGGRLFPRQWTVHRVDKPDHYTRLSYLELAFDVEIDDSIFTLTSLKSRRR